MSTEVSPTEPSTPRYSAIFGRRRSLSTSATRMPACASVMARLHAVVDSPSPATAEVMTTVRGGRSMSTNCRFVRSVRNDSDRVELGSIAVMSGCFAGVAVDTRSCRARPRR